MYYHIKKDLGRFHYVTIEYFTGYDDDFQERFDELHTIHGGPLIAEYSDEPFTQEEPVPPPKQPTVLTPKRLKSRKAKTTPE